MAAVAQSVYILAPAIYLFVGDQLFPTLSFFLTRRWVLIDISQCCIFPLGFCWKTVIREKNSIFKSYLGTRSSIRILQWILLRFSSRTRGSLEFSEEIRLRIEIFLAKTLD